MGQQSGSLPDRVRPSQVLLGVGAVLLVLSGAVVAAAYGGVTAAVVLIPLAATATAFSLRAARAGLRTSEEMLAACAAALALAGSSPSGPGLDGDPVTAVLLAIVFLVLHASPPQRPPGRSSPSVLCRWRSCGCTTPSSPTSTPSCT